MTTNTNTVTNPADTNTATSAPVAPPTTSTQSSTLNGIAGALATELNKLIALLVQLEQLSQNSVEADINMGYAETDHVADQTRSEAKSNADAVKMDAWAAILSAAATITIGVGAMAKSRFDSNGEKLSKVSNELNHLNKINEEHFVNPQYTSNVTGTGDSVTATIQENGQAPQTAILTAAEQARIDELTTSSSDVFRSSKQYNLTQDPLEDSALWKKDSDQEIFKKISSADKLTLKQNLDKRMDSLNTQKTGLESHMQRELNQSQLFIDLGKSGATAVFAFPKSKDTSDAGDARAASALDSNMASQANQMTSQMSGVRDKAADMVTSNIQQFVQIISGMYHA